jgi:hypothetical protein
MPAIIGGSRTLLASLIFSIFNRQAATLGDADFWAVSPAHAIA